MFCTSCGKEIEDTAVFCHHCGTPAEQGRVAPPPAAPVPTPSTKPWYRSVIGLGLIGLLLAVAILLAALFLREPATEFVEVTRQVTAASPREVTRVVTEAQLVEVEVPIEVTRVVVETIIAESEMVEVTRVVTETIIETIVEEVPVEVTRIVEVAADGSALAVNSAGSTLAAVREKGVVDCGTVQNVPGFSNLDSATNAYTGLDVDFCRAVATAVLGNADAVEIRPASSTQRFPLLQSGDVDLLFGNTAQTLSRDTSLGFNYGPVTFHDGQGFLVARDSGIESLEDLNGRTICVQTNSTAETNLSLLTFRTNITYTPQGFTDWPSAVTAYEDGTCDALTTDQSGLIAQMSSLSSPGSHTILPETLTKQPLAPAVRQGDDNWYDVVSWAINCTLHAEEQGLTSENVDDLLAQFPDAIGQLLGQTNNLGELLDLDNDFCYQIINQVGNYAEIFNRNLGSETILNLPRGQNALYLDGGLLFSPPFK